MNGGTQIFLFKHLYRNISMIKGQGLNALREVRLK